MKLDGMNRNIIVLELEVFFTIEINQVYSLLLFFVKARVVRKQ